MTTSVHRLLRKGPRKNVVLRAFLLAGYVFLFSVQICFRYTPESLDLDTFAAASTSIAHSKVQGRHHSFQVLHHGEHSVHSHILNKRFEPVVAVAIPAQEFRVTHFCTARRISFPLSEVKIPGRDALNIALRGPPAEAC